ncbi:MAG TPA: hypothetical protein VH641_15990 [Streptosporangiaceae bacterium]|jgi:hypothetical protein
MRLATATFASAVAVAMLAGCHVDVPGMQHRTKQYSVGQVRVLAVTAHVGDVQLTGGDSAQVTVTERISFRHTAPVTSHRVSGGTLTLDSHCPDGGACGVDYQITLPRSLTVRVTDNVGSIRLRSLSGPVTAHTNAGSINLESLSGPVTATGHVGSVNGQQLSCRQATLRSSVGAVQATFTSAPASVTAATGVGTVTLRLPAAAHYAVTAHANIGKTRVSVTRSSSSSHRVMASTKTGSVTVEPVP